MGWLFKTPSDDATEATLRALHTQNVLDNYYERGRGLLFAVLLATATGLAVSWFEYGTDISVWENTVEWAKNKVMGWIS